MRTQCVQWDVESEMSDRPGLHRVDGCADCEGARTRDHVPRQGEEGEAARIATHQGLGAASQAVAQASDASPPRTARACVVTMPKCRPTGRERGSGQRSPQQLRVRFRSLSTSPGPAAIGASGSARPPARQAGARLAGVGRAAPLLGPRCAVLDADELEPGCRLLGPALRASFPAGDSELVMEALSRTRWRAESGVL